MSGRRKVLALARRRESRRECPFRAFTAGGRSQSGGGCAILRAVRWGGVYSEAPDEIGEGLMRRGRTPPGAARV